MLYFHVPCPILPRKAPCSSPLPISPPPLYLLCSLVARLTPVCGCRPKRYGVGMIYSRQEKHDLAERHFLKAVSINSSSPVRAPTCVISHHRLPAASLRCTAGPNPVPTCPAACSERPLC